MFDVAPDHAIGLYTGLLALLAALGTLRWRGKTVTPGTAAAAAALMATSGGVHLGLVWTHRAEPITALLFIGNGLCYLVLSPSDCCWSQPQASGDGAAHGGPPSAWSYRSSLSSR